MKKTIVLILIILIFVVGTPFLSDKVYADEILEENTNSEEQVDEKEEGALLATPTDSFDEVLDDSKSLRGNTIIERSGNTNNWYEDYEYEIDGDKILLKNYIGTDTDIYVPKSAVIDGVEYNTIIKYTDGYYHILYGESWIDMTINRSIWAKSVDDEGYPNSTIKNIVFEEGFVFYENTDRIFAWCGSLENIDFNGADTSNVTNMSYMFEHCDSLTNIDLSCFNTIQVTDMYYMFNDCSGLVSVNVSNFDTCNVNNMGGMFVNCRKLKNLDLSNFIINKNANTGIMLEYCEALETIKVPVNLEKNISLPKKFYDIEGNEYESFPIDLSESITMYNSIQEVSTNDSKDVVSLEFIPSDKNPPNLIEGMYDWGRIFIDGKIKATFSDGTFGYYIYDPDVINNFGSDIEKNDYLYFVDETDPYNYDLLSLNLKKQIDTTEWCAGYENATLTLSYSDVKCVITYTILPIDAIKFEFVCSDDYPAEFVEGKITGYDICDILNHGKMVISYNEQTFICWGNGGISYYDDFEPDIDYYFFDNYTNYDIIYQLQTVKANMYELSHKEAGDKDAKVILKLKKRYNAKWPENISVKIPITILPSPDVTEIVVDGTKYEICDTAVTWAEADAMAREKGGHLLTLPTLQEKEKFDKALKNGLKLTMSAYWIGYTDIDEEGEFKWVTGEKGDYTNFRDEQPDNMQDEDYVGIWTSDLKWNDFSNRWFALGGNGIENVGFIIEYDHYGYSHNWVEGAHNDPTCTLNGYQEYVCDKCGEVNKEIIEATGHTEIQIPEVVATCTENGQIGGTKCSVCDTILEEPNVVEAFGHNWDEGTITIKASCTEDGEKICTCTRDGCNATETVTVVAQGHTEETIPAVASTCTNRGKTEGKRCSVCKEIIEAPKDVLPLGHLWDNGRVTTAPTCTEDGEMTYSCRRYGCSNTKTESIKANGHIKETIPAVSATYTSTGLTAGSRCKECGEVIKEQKIVSYLSGIHKSSSDGNWYYMCDGKVNTEFTGIAEYKENKTWYFVRNGKMDKTYSGVAQATNGIWYYVTKGKIDRSFTGQIAKATNGRYYYISKGKPTKNYDQKMAYCPEDKKYYYCSNGRVDFSFSGKLVYCTDGNWYFVKKGTIDKSFTGIATATNGAKYYVVKGTLNKKYTGSVKYNGKTYKVVKGKVQ